MSLKMPEAVYSASKRKCTAAGGDIQVPWGGIQLFTSDGSRNKWIDTQICKANAVLHELYFSVHGRRKGGRGSRPPWFSNLKQKEAVYSVLSGKKQI